MKLTSEKALELLDEARGKAKDDHWIEHSICVGNTAEIIAKKLNLDSEKAKTLGTTGTRISTARIPRTR